MLSATPAALGQLRVRSIEEAQARIVDAVRRLQAGGEIIVKPWPHLLDG
ncbi:MAG: FliG C-terminal domain-containing protein [Chloroflexota bacterium]